MTPKIYLVFVDDWELRGNGSGDVESMQIKPMRELVAIFDRYSIRGSFNAEVMQQLAFRKLQDRHPELKQAADAWDAEIKRTYVRGHDVQLHIHPQWHDAVYTQGRWQLTSDWSILNYSPDDARRILTDCRNYLESLIRTIDADYRCISFRSGSWCIAPSPFMFDLLVELGIVFDVSIVAGVRYNTRKIKLDYTHCEETFLPYYPLMTDARRVSDNIERIVCVPTNHFYASGPQVLGYHLGRAVAGVREWLTSDAPSGVSGPPNARTYSDEWADIAPVPFPSKLFAKGIVYAKGKHFISDIARLSYPLLCEMLSSIRRRAAETELAEVPVILTNHTKDITDLSAVERFVADVAKADDIECITLTELAVHLQSGRFRVRSGQQHIG